MVFIFAQYKVILRQENDRRNDPHLFCLVSNSKFAPMTSVKA